MKIKQHIRHDFNRMNPSDKYSFGQRVVKQLTQNASLFQHLPCPVSELAEINNTLWQNYLLYKNQGRDRAGAFREAEDIWLHRFRLTAHYIDALANGNSTLLGKSGFHLSKSESRRSARLDAVKLKHVQGTELQGTVMARISTNHDARGYFITMFSKDVQVRQGASNQLIFQSGDTFISIIIGNEKNVQFSGLPKLTRMKVVASAFNRAGLGMLSGESEVSVP